MDDTSRIVAEIAKMRAEWKAARPASFATFCRMFDNDTLPATLADWKTTLLITTAVWHRSHGPDADSGDL